jgi:CTP:molybdopterin cytidylyltransferase MocA
MARYADADGHPVAMQPDLWRRALAEADADEGARRFLAEHRHLVDLIAAPGAAGDLDTPADLS